MRRLRTRDGRRQMVWCPMNKGVINLHRYREVSLAANERYLEASRWSRMWPRPIVRLRN